MISLFFLGFLLLALLWNQYYTKHWHKNLMITLNFLQEFVYAGDQAEMTEQIENRKRLVLPVLEVAFHVDKKLAFHDCENTSVSDFTYKRDIFALLGNQRVTRKLTLNCTHRGYYRIDKSFLTAFSMLHRRRFSMEFPADTELYVYAARTNVSNILVTCERLMGSVQCAKRLFEDPFAYASIREYTVTDPMKTINWKASARTGELMVNTFESTHMEKVMIFLDVEDSGILKYEYLTEDSISVAASLAQKMIAKGMEVGLCTNIVSDQNSSKSIPASTDKKLSTDMAINRNLYTQDTFTYLPPVSGRKQLSDIERLLAGHRTDAKTAPLPDILGGFTGQTEDATLIFISKNAVQNQPAIETFVDKDKQAVWIVPYPVTESCDVHSEGNIHLIKRGIYDT